MTFVKRAISREAELLSTQFRALSIIGPRQSGKTTLSKWLFGKMPYVSLENPATQALAEENPQAFLEMYPEGAILDEVQRVPQIFRYLQGILDSRSDRMQFVLTGSNNFLLQERIAQSLAGRIGYLQLLPFSYAELCDADLAADHVQRHIVTGGYPEIWDQGLIPGKWAASYFQTYIQRDVRMLRNITNLGDFTRFIQLCATRAGQLINREEMARSIGVDTKTIQSWLGVLESSYVIFLLQPWYNNLNKRIVKSPKLYFYDSGVLCYLLGIRSQKDLQKHSYYGSLFENWIIAEIKKNRFNQGVEGGLFFFRDSAGNEVDLVMEKQGVSVAVEIKSASKMNVGMVSGLKYWLKNNRDGQGILIYGGERSEEISGGMQLSGWRNVANV